MRKLSPSSAGGSGIQAAGAVQDDGGVKVSVVALSENEASGVMGVNVARRGIQPVWIKIENHERIGFVIPPMVIDHDYFSPTEAAWQVHGWLTPATNARIDDHFRKLRLPLRVGPGETISGFVFTNLDQGVKYISIECIGSGAVQVRRFAFLAKIPDLTTDYEGANYQDPQWKRVYRQEEIQNLDEVAFRAWVEALPCCTVGGDRKTPGDPVDIVFVGEGPILALALARQGWHVTETITPGSAWRTISSSVFGSHYRYGPVSALYFFGRHQDIAVQKARNDVNLRNHMRLWRAPVNFNGTPVWVGQISRDIGVRLTTKTITTHKIDPDVDGARWYLMQDMFYSQSLHRFAFANGVGAATPQNPRVNFTGDPYWTDGLRLVMWLANEPVAYQRVQSERWELPPR
jgi:LssY C-terminus